MPNKMMLKELSHFIKMEFNADCSVAIHESGSIGMWIGEEDPVLVAMIQGCVKGFLYGRYNMSSKVIRKDKPSWVMRMMRDVVNPKA